MTKPSDDELDPVERRSIPRGPVGGVTVVGVDPPLSQGPITVAELSLESLFLQGEAAEHCVIGQSYRLRLEYGEQEVLCRARCVRREDSPRRGVALCFAPDEREARALLVEILKPAAVPRDAD